MGSNSGVRQLFRSVFPGASQRRRSIVRRTSAVDVLEQRIVPALVVPVLNSLPNAPVNVYLDFDGHIETHPNWNNGNSIDTPAYSLDTDRADFSTEELRRIEEMWYRVSEDFAPFAVNVTTVAPAAINDFESIRVVIGGNGAWYGGGAVGVAILNGFSVASFSNTVFVFPELDQNPKHISNTISHEAGHCFGLEHQSSFDANGNKTDEYRQGTLRLGPIMGFSDQSLRDVWDIGPSSPGANVIQDDMAVMTRTANQTFRFRQDDFASTGAAAASIPATNGSIDVSGILETNTDSDFFLIEADAGPLSVTVSTLDLNLRYPGLNLNPGTNLDSIVRLYSESGTLLLEDDPQNSFGGVLNLTVARGKYLLEVTSVDENGAVGQYTVTGSFNPLPSIPTMVAPTGVVSEPLPSFIWTVASNAASYELEVDDLTRNVQRYYTATEVATLHQALTQFAEGDFQARVRAVTTGGLKSEWSNYVTFSVDIPSPGTPSILRPIGEIGLSLPVFEWTKPANASSYELLVMNVDTGERVIYKTNYIGTTYIHFVPIPDGNYTAEVRAGNAIGEFSSWSRRVEFTIKAPIPGAPVLKSPNVITTSQNPRFTWDLIESAAYYDLWVNNKTTGKTQILRKTDIPGTDNFYDPPFFDQGVYTAWLRGVNGNNVAGKWSAPLTFTVDVLPPGKVTIKGPMNPDKSTLITTLNPTFQWTSAIRAVRYELWANNVTTGQLQIIRRSDIKDTTFTSLANLTQGFYRCWVRAINSANEVGEWSNVYTFTIDEPTPQIPVITGPAINPAGSVDNANPTFTWRMGVDAPFYQFLLYEVNPRTSQLSIYINQFGLTQKSFTIPFDKRLKEQSYVARVRAYNVSGDYSNWSSDYRIRIDVPDPVTPTLLGPAGTLNDNTPLFNWTHDKASFRYEVLIRDLERNENIVLQVSSFGVNPEGTQAFYTLPDNMALRNSTYRWWARAFNSMGASGGWSNAGTFVIRVTAAEKPADQPLAALPGQTLLASLPQRAERPEVRRAANEALAVDHGYSEVAPVEPVAKIVPTNVPGVPGEQSMEQQLIDEALWRLINPAAVV
ncbi:MAG: Calcium-dependent protease precursor [Planctomycetota bacterium]